ncbi:MAG: RNA 2',3'-cyclic phosphodiesterase [Deltaproteobacteria bacterium]|nr:RNA 2',3'-cyclic phosphodiesterase [Deltaproteobacteria bacterium]
MAGWRSFIAVELSKEIAAGVRRIQGGLRERLAGVSWVRPEGIHLTLKFLGDVDPERIEGIASTSEEYVKAIAPFTIGIRGCGGFPNPRNPRVIWIGVDDPSGQLKELQAKVEQGMEEMGITREARGYTPHLTIGRLRSGKGKGDVAQAFEAMKGCDLGTMEVREICLFRSQLKPTGAEYTKLKVIPLSGMSH